MRNVRYRVLYDEDPDLSYLEQWDTPEKYEGNEVLEGDRTVPFEEYIETYGNPDRHVVMCLLKESQCDHCGSWNVVDSLGGIDFMDWDFPETGVFESIEDLPSEMRGYAEDFEDPSELRRDLFPDT